MKKTFLKTSLSVMCIALLALQNCGREDIIPEPQSVNNSLSEQGTDENAKTEPAGYGLTYNGDGRWYGALSGCTVWFWGPTPSQIANGMQSAWTLATGCADPNSSQTCYTTGYAVSGDGYGFTVQNPACAVMTTSTITMLETEYNEDTLSWEWIEVIKEVMTFTSGTCSIFASAKIIINPDDCSPIIVSPESDDSQTCGGIGSPV